MFSFYHGRGVGVVYFVCVLKKVGRVKNTHPCEGVRMRTGAGDLIPKLAAN